MKPTLGMLGMIASVGLVLAAGPMLGMIASVGLVLAAGPDNTSDDVKSDLARLKGTWIGELDGKTFIVNFNGEKFATIFEFKEGTTTTSGTITIDPTKMPKHMDWQFADGTGRAEKLKGATAATIYQLDGDTFKFCTGGKEGSREEFPDKEGDGEYIYIVFKRAK